MNQPQPQLSLQGGAGLVPGTDGKTLIVIGITIGGAQFITPPMDPHDAAAFVKQLAVNVTEAADNARRHNLGLIVAGNSNSNGLNPGDLSALRRQQ